MNQILEFLVANPIFLTPILIVVAVMVFAVLKKLLKLASIVFIAGALYVVLMEYMAGRL